MTAREQQVADLVASGYRNAEIAAQLGITLRTAEAHVANILRKLNVRSRVGIAARDDSLPPRPQAHIGREYRR